MADYVNMKTCAVTGQRYEAGDYVCKADFGTYVVKASVDYTPELREKTEAALKETIAATANEAPRDSLSFVEGMVNHVNENIAARERRARRSESVEPPSEG